MAEVSTVATTGALPNSPTCMESVNRLAKLPVVESTIQTATNIYGKVKEYNTMTQWTCSTAESAVNKAVEVGKPIVHGLEGPIKTVDGVLCTGLDFVESKVPAVKMPPGEIVNKAYSYVEPAVKSAYEKLETAKPAMDRVVDPLVQTATAIKDYGVHKLEEILSCGHAHPEGNPECAECKKVANAQQVEQNQN